MFSKACYYFNEAHSFYFFIYLFIELHKYRMK